MNFTAWHFGKAEDTTIAHLTVTFNSKQIKTGSTPNYITMYNQLIRIEEILVGNAIYPKGKIKFEL